MSKKLVLVALPLLALAACKEPSTGEATTPTPPVETPPAEAPPAATAPVTGKAEWDFSAMPAADATLEIVPATVDFCSSSLQAVTVRWNVPTSWRVPEIWVQTATTPKLFAAPRDHAGEEPTGEWVREDTVFFLVDAATSRVLQQTTPAPADCGD